MGDKFSLTLTNQSDQPGLTFAVYTTLPLVTDGNAFAIAWLAKPLNKGNNVEFTWTLDYTLMFSARGAQAGAKWKENGSIPVNDLSTDTNSITLDYVDGDYLLKPNPGGHPVRDGVVYLDSTGQVPRWTAVNGPSVALAIATGDDGKPMPAIAGNSGPALSQTFELHPTYYIRAGQVEQGQMADLETMTRYQKVEFTTGSYAAAWTLGPDNTWRKD